MNAFVLKVLDSSASSVYKLQAMQLLTFILTTYGNSDQINLYLEAFDLSGTAPFVQNVIKALLNQIGNSKQLENIIMFRGVMSYPIHELTAVHYSLPEEKLMVE